MAKPKRGFHAYIDSVYLDTRLKPKEKLLLIFIAKHVNFTKDQPAYPAIQTIADACCISYRTAWTYIHSLCEKGWLEEAGYKATKKGKVLMWRVKVPPMQFEASDMQKQAELTAKLVSAYANQVSEIADKHIKEHITSKTYKEHINLEDTPVGDASAVGFGIEKSSSEEISLMNSRGKLSLGLIRLFQPIFNIKEVADV
jgi:hypothetical protein